MLYEIHKNHETEINLESELFISFEAVQRFIKTLLSNLKLLLQNNNSTPTRK